MKKYWKSIAILVVILLSIGTYYVNAAMSAEEYPEFVIQTVSGDAKEMQPLVLDSSYAADTSTMSYTFTSLKISADGSTYNSGSFLDQLIGQPPTLIKTLRKEHPTFMRGKDPFADYFFEDDDFLAYAEVEYNSLRVRNFKFDIAVLNKKNEKVNSFKVKVPNDGGLENVVIEDVQMVDGVLYLITHNVMSNHNEKHIYTIDVGNQKISSHEAIIQVPESQDDLQTDLQFIRTNPTKANNQLIIVKMERRMMEDAESSREEVVGQEVISYNIATKDQEIIKVPDLKLDGNQLSYFDDSTIYFMSIDGEDLVVTPYRLEDDRAGQPFRINLSGEDGVANGPMTTVKDGKLYVATSQMTSRINAEVIVADAHSGKTLFKGQVALKDPSKEKGNFELYINELFLDK